MMMEISEVKPSFLQSGDKVCIVAPARKVSKEELQPAIDVLKSWGLYVTTGANLYNEFNQFAGTDQERHRDLQDALDDGAIKAVFCARGGYGTPRIIDSVRWDSFVRDPKWVVGFSDITVLLNCIAKQGICSLHAPMPLFFTQEEYGTSVQKLREFLFGSPYKILTNSCPLNKSGEVTGKVMGGNLSLIVNSIGTNTELPDKSIILFIEDIDEYFYHIDRMMLQLKRSGILHRLGGLIVGHFTDMKDNKVPFGMNAYEIISDNVKEFGYPVAFNFPAGHAPQNLPVPFGQTCRLKVTDKDVSVEFY